MGLSYEALKKQHPSLIVCDISGYGQDGPYRDKKAYDLLIQSEAGVLDVTDTKTEPVKVGLSIADIAAGMYAYSNILSALLHRKTTGSGTWIDISMLESMVEWMGFPMYYAWNGGSRPEPNGAAHASIYPYGPFQTVSGESVMLGIQDEREWKSFCTTVLGKPELFEAPQFSSNSLRLTNKEELGAIINKIFADLSADEVIARLDRAPIANRRMNTLQEVWDRPQLKARGRWRKANTPTGTIETLLPPGVTSESDVRLEPIPAVEAHTQAIIEELRLTGLEPSQVSEEISQDTVTAKGASI